jgi:ATP-binding cassette subfamily B protein
LLVDYLRPQWLWATLLAALLFSNIGLQLVNPQIMRHFIDTATLDAQAGMHRREQAGPETGLAPVPQASAERADASKTLLRAALLFIGVALAQQVVSVLATYVSENVGWAATNALRADLADHCLRLDMSFHNARTPGEMIERIDGDVTALSNFFSQFVIQVFGNALLLSGVLILLFREDWRVGLTLAGFALLTLLTLGRMANIAVPHWEAQREASANMYGFLEERLAGTEDIRSSGAKAYVMRRFYELMREVMNKALKAGWMVNVLVNTIDMLFALGMALAFAVGAHLFLEGMITIGTVYIVFHYATMVVRPIQRIVFQMQDLQRAGAGIARIQELFQAESKIRWQISESMSRRIDESARLDIALQGGAPAVEFEGVSFGYDGASPGNDVAKSKGMAPGELAPAEKEMVLHNLSLRLQPGTVLGLLGRTGSGKTTMTRLLFRLYDPDNGTIRLGTTDGLRDIRQLPLIDLRRRVGMVTQNVQLFHATVRDNLTFFDRSIPDERILEVIQELELGEWLQSLPEGLDAELESGGGGLSAGEAQLLAFARIFLRDPRLVILDEASSRLDPTTERLIERAVDRLVQNRTAIIIAHRLSTVQRADEIVILEEGRICEHGVRSELASDPDSRFYGLLQTGLEEVLA